MPSSRVYDDAGVRDARPVENVGPSGRISPFGYFDDWFVRKTLSGRLHKFCEWHIHPNVITGFALVLAALIPVFHFLHLIWAVTVALVLRQFFDCLDGEVARCCGKTSKAGGLLDAIGDCIYFFAITILFVSLIVPHPRRALIIASVSFAAVFAVHLSICKWSMLVEHAMKTYSTPSLYKKGYAFLVNNSLIFSLAAAVLYSLLVKEP